MGKLVDSIVNFFVSIISKSKNNSRKEEFVTTIDGEDVNIKNINYELIERLNNYDIVLVKIEKNKKSVNDSDNNVVKIPFIIMEKIDNLEVANGYYLTSNIKNNFFTNSPRYNGLKLVLDRNNYHLKLNSLIQFNMSVDVSYDNIIHYIDHLNDSDLNRLKKYEQLLNEQEIKLQHGKNNIEVGDIILDNNIWYIVYQVDNINCYGYPIYKYNDYVNLEKNLRYIEFCNDFYFVDYSKNKIFDLSNPVCIIKRFNDDVVDTIRENKKIIKSKNKVRK